VITQSINKNEEILIQEIKSVINNKTKLDDLIKSKKIDEKILSVCFFRIKNEGSSLNNGGTLNELNLLKYLSNTPLKMKQAIFFNLCNSLGYKNIYKYINLIIKKNNFYKQKTHAFTCVYNCLITDKEIGKIINLFFDKEKEYFNKNEIRSDEETYLYLKYLNVKNIHYLDGLINNLNKNNKLNVYHLVSILQSFSRKKIDVYFKYIENKINKEFLAPIVSYISYYNLESQLQNKKTTELNKYKYIKNILYFLNKTKINKKIMFYNMMYESKRFEDLQYILLMEKNLKKILNKTKFKNKPMDDMPKINVFMEKQKLLDTIKTNNNLNIKRIKI
jgi:hypothetical protein